MIMKKNVLVLVAVLVMAFVMTSCEKEAIVPEEIPLTYSFWGSSFDSEKQVEVPNSYYTYSKFSIYFSIQDLDSSIYFNLVEPVAAHWVYFESGGSQYVSYNISYCNIESVNYNLYEDSIVIIGWNRMLESEAKVKLTFIEKNNALIVCEVDTENLSKIGQRSYGKVWFKLN